MRVLRTTCVLVVILVASQVAGTFSAASAKGRALGLAGDLGVGGVGGEAVATVQTGVDVQEGNLALGLFGRVRFLMQDDGEGGAVRQRDWDEVSDYVHILRYLQYRRSFLSKAVGEVRLAFQAGEILGYTLGHGTLIRDYTNIGDPDHAHAGLHFQVSGTRWHWATMLDNFINPSIIANRFALRPFEKLPGLAFGSSLVIDPRAPMAIRSTEQADRPVDSAFNLETDNKVLTLAGLEVEYEIGDKQSGRVTPYADLNTSMLGLGLHLGATGDVPLGGSGARLLGQLEYRVASGGYAPAHVETFYDVERYQAGLSFTDPGEASVDERSPKLTGLARGSYGGQGLLGQFGFRFRRKVALKIGVSYRPGPDAVSLWWRATSKPIPRLQLGLMVLARGLSGPHEGAGGLMTIGEGRVRITDTLYGLAQYTRSWSLDATTHYYGILQSFNLSLGATWSG